MISVSLESGRKKPTVAIFPRRIPVFFGALFLFLGFILSPGRPHEVDIESWNQGSRYFTRGTITTEGWHSEASELILDFDSYSQWALRYMDGNDPVSAESWVHFTDFIYEEPLTMVLHYDLNLFWPLNIKNNQAPFTLSISQPEKRSPEKKEEETVILFSLIRPPFGLHDAQLKLTLGPDTQMSFLMELHLWGLLDAIMNMKYFRLFMEDRIFKITQNMIEFLGVSKESIP